MVLYGLVQKVYLRPLITRFLSSCLCVCGCVCVCVGCARVCVYVCLFVTTTLSPSFCFDQRSACWNGDFDRWKIPITWSNVLRNMRIKKTKEKIKLQQQHAKAIVQMFQWRLNFLKSTFSVSKKSFFFSCPYLWKVFWIFLLNASRQGATRISKQRTIKGFYNRKDRH